MLYYSYPQIVLQEVQDEISLALSISGCNLHCKGCHSTETFKPTFGSPLDKKVLRGLIESHKHITCILFYGGEWEPETLVELFKECKGLKICLYTGLDMDDVPHIIIPHLNYIKTGRYIKELGGLDSSNTNQRFIKLKD